MKVQNNKVLDAVYRVLVVVFTNTLLSLSIVWFLEPAHLYSGGANGVAQLINRLLILIFNRNVIPLGWLVFLINVPILIIGFKYVSKKFAIYSALAVIVQTTVLNFIPEIPQFTAIGQNIMVAGGPEEGIKNYGGLLTLAIIYGCCAGFATGFALRNGTSTGGVDVISQAVALHHSMSLGKITLLINASIAFIGGGVIQKDWIIVIFTIICMLIDSITVDKVHISYTLSAMNIFSSKGEEISEKIMNEIHRGCTFVPVEGAYSHTRTTELYCVVSTYEVEKVIKITKTIDKNAFITVTPVRKVNGNFLKKTIV